MSIPVSGFITESDKQYLSHFINEINLYFRLQRSLANITNEQKLYKYSISSLIEFANADIEKILAYYNSTEAGANAH